MLTGILIHSGLGACISFFICNRFNDSWFKRLFILSMGGIVGISPDLTKYFGDIFGHTFWYAAIVGLIIAWFARYNLKDISLRHLWLAMTLTVIFGHLLVDFLGNGIAFLYPFIKTEFYFHIIRDKDYLIYTLLLFAIIITMLKGKWRKFVFIIIILLLVSYIGFRTYSKLTLYDVLQRHYKAYNAEIIIYPHFLDNTKWSYQIRYNHYIVNGDASIYNHQIQEKE